MKFDKKAHYYDGFDKGFAKGLSETRTESVKKITIKFYQKKYPNEDKSWLKNLTEKQYDEIFDMLLNDENLDEIKRVIDEKRVLISL